jgi:hypothetical protein
MTYQNFDDLFYAEQGDEQRRSVACSLYVSGASLIGIFACIAIISRLPIDIFSPIWQQGLVGSLQSGGVYLLLGVCLLFVANALTPGITNLRSIRKICRLIAICWLILIPLQLWSGVKALQGVHAQQNQLAGKYGAIARSLASVAGEAELRDMIAKIPEAPQLPSSLGSDFPKLKSQLVADFNATAARIREEAGKAHRDRIQEWLLSTAKVIVTSLFYALAFSALSGARLRLPLLPRNH